MTITFSWTEKWKVQEKNGLRARGVINLEHPFERKRKTITYPWKFLLSINPTKCVCLGRI
jgi:hypothetical protein